MSLGLGTGTRRGLRRVPVRLLFWVFLGGFFVFALGYPLLYVFKRAFTVPGPVRVVKPGQGLEDFAREHGASVEKIRRWKKLGPDEAPPPGTALQIGPDRPGLAHFGRLLGDPVSRRWIGNSLLLGIVVTVLCFALALPLAFLSARRSFPGKTLLTMLVLVPLILPPFVGAIGMRRVLSRFGSLNLILMGLGLTGEPLDFLGAGKFWGVAVMEALHLYPIMYLNLVAALSGVDPSLEEAASSLGDSGWRRFRRVTLPLMMPGIFAGCAIVFVWAFTDLGTPLVFQYQEVVSKRIFDMTQSVHVDPLGYALVVLVLAVTGTLFLLGRHLARRRPVASVTKGLVKAEVITASRWERRAAYALFGGLALVSMLPHLAVALEAFSGRWFMTVLPEEFTLAHVGKALTHEDSAAAVRNSVLLSLGSTALNLGLGLAIAIVVVRSRFRFRGAIDALAMLPLAIPGVVLAFGYVGAYSGMASFLTPRENPVLLLIVSYAARRLPFVVRSCVAGLEQTPEVYEEASRSLGAGSALTLRRVTLPLLGPYLIAGGILAFSFAMLEVSDSLILAMKQQFYPITKAIYVLSGRLSDGPAVACALGLFGMALLALSLWAAASFLGKRLGEVFRA